MLLFYLMLSFLAFLLFGNPATSHKGTVIRSALFLVILLPIFQMSGGSTAGERIFMFVFPILLYELCKSSNHLIFSVRTQEIALFVIFCGPTLAVYSSRQFLT